MTVEGSPVTVVRIMEAEKALQLHQQIRSQLYDGILPGVPGSSRKNPSLVQTWESLENAGEEGAAIERAPDLRGMYSVLGKQPSLRAGVLRHVDGVEQKGPILSSGETAIVTRWEREAAIEAAARVAVNVVRAGWHALSWQQALVSVPSAASEVRGVAC